MWADDPNDRRFTDKEEARDYIVRVIAGNRRQMQDPKDFASFDRSAMITHYEFCLRWLDCAPEGARFSPAPLCDKQGHSMGGVYDENVGPNQAVRKIRAAKGLTPFAPLTYRA